MRWHPPPHGSQCRVHGLHVGLHKRCRPQKHLGPAKDPPHVPLPPEQRADRARDDVVGQGLVVDPQRTQHGVCIVGNGACEVLQGRIAWRPWVAVPHRHCLHCTLCIIAHINDGQLQVAQLPLVCGFVIRLDVQRVDVMLELRDCAVDAGVMDAALRDGHGMVRCRAKEAHNGVVGAASNGKACPLAPSVGVLDVVQLQPAVVLGKVGAGSVEYWGVVEVVAEGASCTAFLVKVWAVQGRWG